MQFFSSSFSRISTTLTHTFSSFLLKNMFLRIPVFYNFIPPFWIFLQGTQAKKVDDQTEKYPLTTPVYFFFEMVWPNYLENSLQEDIIYLTICKYQW